LFIFSKAFESFIKTSQATYLMQQPGIEPSLLLVFNSKDYSISSLAVKILSKEWPLPLKTLKRKLLKEHGKSVSYQATHKAMGKLLDLGVLVKTELHYELNTEWLKQLEKFSRETRRDYETKSLF
jgi:hypothetical protein